MGLEMPRDGDLARESFHSERAEQLPELSSEGAPLRFPPSPLPQNQQFRNCTFLYRSNPALDEILPLVRRALGGAFEGMAVRTFERRIPGSALREGLRFFALGYEQRGANELVLCDASCAKELIRQGGAVWAERCVIVERLVSDVLLELLRVEHGAETYDLFLSGEAALQHHHDLVANTGKAVVSLFRSYQEHFGAASQVLLFSQHLAIHLPFLPLYASLAEIGKERSPQDKSYGEFLEKLFAACSARGYGPLLMTKEIVGKFSILSQDLFGEAFRLPEEYVRNWILESGLVASKEQIQIFSQKEERTRLWSERNQVQLSDALIIADRHLWNDIPEEDMGPIRQLKRLHLPLPSLVHDLVARKGVPLSLVFPKGIIDSKTEHYLDILANRVAEKILLRNKEREGELG